MTRCVVAWVLITVLLMVSGSTSMAEGDGDARLPEDDYEMIGGTTWTKDIRITHNSADDNLPQVVVDASDMAHLIWQR